MKKLFFLILLVLPTAVGVVAAFAAGETYETADETADVVVLGEGDLADRAEIVRNRYRRMTPGDAPLNYGDRPLNSRPSPIGTVCLAETGNVKGNRQPGRHHLGGMGHAP